jgi:hypothetical protein
MKKVKTDLVLMVLATSVIVTASCSNQSKQDQSTQASSGASMPAASPEVATSRQAKSGRTGTLTANPNPIKVCDGSGTGVTTLSWTVSSTGPVEVHVTAPDGPLFSRAEDEGHSTTGKWATEGMVFYLQDVADGSPLTADYTMATTTVRLTSAGCQ